MTIRIIPRLDVKGPNLVKGIHMEGLRVLGRPEVFARYYAQSGADELFYYDTVASLYGRSSLLDIIGKTAREVFIPITVGGGLRTLDDIKNALRAGADKVSLNTAAVANPQLIAEAARKFGSSTIVVSIEAIRQPDGRYLSFTDYGREQTGLDAYEWALRAVELGAGELIVIAVDREGTGSGFDLGLVERIARAVPVPVIAAGGAGRVDHAVDVVSKAKADAVCLASLLHYHLVRTLPPDHQAFDSGEGNMEFLKRGGGNSRIQDADIAQVKAAMTAAGIAVRPVGDFG